MRAAHRGRLHRAATAAGIWGSCARGAGVQESRPGTVVLALTQPRAGEARAGQGAERYSRKVQQPARIPEDRCAHPETLTCTHILLWMPCLLSGA
jgi:hypothetical protein